MPKNANIRGYGVGTPLVDLALKTIVANRAPTAADTGYEVGQQWDDESAGNLWGLTRYVSGTPDWELLGGSAAAVATLTGNSGTALPSSGNINIVGSNPIQVTGAGSTLAISPNSGGYPVTPFVVGPVSQAGYQTIQSAITAASAAFVATGNEQSVWIQPGTYTENLTLANGVDLIGAGSISQGAGNGVTIVGVHTPPATGHIVLRNIYWSSATHILSSAVAGTCHIHFIDTESGVTNGFLMNLPNWTGTLEIENYNPGTGATNDGGINNSGGSTILLFNAGLGWGTTQTCVISGPCLMESGEINCPVNFITGAILDIEWMTFRNSVTMSNNSTGFINFSSFITGANTPLTHSSTGTLDLSTCSIDSSASPVIAGAGAGTLTLASITYLDSNTLAGTLTLGTSAEFNVGGSVVAQEVLRAGGDVAGVANTVSVSNVTDEALGAGAGTVLMKTGNPGNSSGWLKIYSGTNVRYVPYWTNISP